MESNKDNKNPNLITKHTNGDGRAGEGEGEELGVGVELLAHRSHRLAKLPDLLLHHDRRLLSPSSSSSSFRRRPARPSERGKVELAGKCNKLEPWIDG